MDQETTALIKDVLVYLLIAGLFFAVVIGVLKMIALVYYLKKDKVFIEITPPSNSDKTPLANKHLFSVIHGLDGSRSWLEKLTFHKIHVSLEIFSTRKGGIRYVICTDEDIASIIEQNILSHTPDAKVSRVSNYLDADNDLAEFLEFKQSGHFAYPLDTQDMLYEYDPVAYLTGAMTQLKPDELISLQIVITPDRAKESEPIMKRLLHNEEYVTSMNRFNGGFAGSLFSGLNSFLFSILDAIGDTFTSAGTRPQDYDKQKIKRKQSIESGERPARTLSAFEQELAQAVNNKLNQPLFRIAFRASVISVDTSSRKQKIKNLKSSLAVFNLTKYQSLKIYRNWLPRIKQPYRKALFTNRMPKLTKFSSNIFSATELADIYHFPHGLSAKTENVIKSHSKTLPAPISLKADYEADLVLGVNKHHGAKTMIGLTKAERERHVYIIGGTGNGKTTMMTYAMVQDIKNGKGLAFIDPHGDAAENILQHIPEARIKDVIYFNPDDIKHPLGLNMLELSPDLSGDELLREKDLITESVISVFRKIFSEEDTGGHRIEYVLRNATQTALTVEGSTLFTIFKLLNDPKYRKQIVRNLEDEDLKNFWKNELGKAGEFQRVKMSAGITAKIGRFLFSASAKRVLEQEKSTIDFDHLINSNKILICNFSKGLLGEDTAELFGITTLAKLQLAALKRARLKQADRKPFYLYVDEFQNFATPSFVQLLSEARKYRLYLLMAEQSTSQQKDQQMVNIILANVGTIICFRSGNPADEQLILPLFAPYVLEGEIANLPSYNYYMKISAVRSQEPFSGETLLLDSEGSELIYKEVIKASRATYAIKKPKAENKTIEKETPKPEPKKPETVALPGV